MKLIVLQTLKLYKLPTEGCKNISVCEMHGLLSQAITVYFILYGSMQNFVWLTFD